MADTKKFTKEDLKIIIPFLETKGCIPQNSQKKLDIETYLDNGDNSIVVVVYKKRPTVLKSLLNEKVLATIEVRANEDYTVLIQNAGANEPHYAERTVYYPHFKEEYLEQQKETNVAKEM